MTEEATLKPPTEEPAAEAPVSPPARPPRRRLALVLGTLAILLLAGAQAWHWYEAREQFQQLRSEVAEQLRQSQNRAQTAESVARDTQQAVQTLQQATAGLEARLLEAQSHQEAVETLYQELARNRDDWLLAEAEQTLAIAVQQLQLAGNVQAALTALQTVDARLARPDRPEFLSIRKVLARDIAKLQSAPTLDVSGMTLRLDQLVERVDDLPVVVEAQPHAAPAAGNAAEEGAWWQQALHSAWDEIKQLVRVERLDAHDPTLLAPEQRYFLRENLKLRLLHARLALLQRDEAAFRNDLQMSQNWLQRYFDTRDPKVVGALQTVEQLRAAAVDVELPSITDSLNAVRSYKLPQERTE